MYKTIFIIYIVSFFCYILFSRVPDYFDGEFVNGVVSEATFSIKEREPVLAVNYKWGNESLKYVTHVWFLTSHKKGQMVKLICNPSNPQIVSIYSFVGYWIKWPELFFTAAVFFILYFAAVFITGKNNTIITDEKDENRKRKYDD